MASFNRVILMGNLTRDPELSWTPGTAESPSVAVARLGLAVSEKYRNKAGEQTENVCFVDIVVWRKQAEHCAEYLKKGSPVLVEGRLQYEQWTNKQGEKRNRLRVKADRVQFLGGAKKAEHPAEPDADDGEKPPENIVSEQGPASGGAVDEDHLPF